MYKLLCNHKTGLASNIYKQNWNWINMIIHVFYICNKPLSKIKTERSMEIPSFFSRMRSNLQLEKLNQVTSSDIDVICGSVQCELFKFWCIILKKFMLLDFQHSLPMSCVVMKSSAVWPVSNEAIANIPIIKNGIVQKAYLNKWLKFINYQSRLVHWSAQVIKLPGKICLWRFQTDVKVKNLDKTIWVFGGVWWFFIHHLRFSSSVFFFFECIPFWNTWCSRPSGDCGGRLEWIIFHRGQIVWSNLELTSSLVRTRRQDLRKSMGFPSFLWIKRVMNVVFLETL